MDRENRAPADLAVLSESGYWRRYLGLFVLALAGTLLLLGFQLHESLVQAEAKAFSDSTNLAKVLERQLDGSVRRLDADLQALAGRIQPREMEPQLAPGFRREWSSYLNSLKVNFAEVMDFYVVDANGDVLYSSGTFKGVNVRDRAHFKRLLVDPSAKLVWTDVVPSKINGRQTIVFARSVRNSAGKFIGIVSVLVDLDYFQSVVAVIDVGSQGLIAIRDAESNKLIIRQPPIAAEINKASKSANYDRIVKGEKLGHSLFTSPLDHKTRYTTFLVLKNFPFYIYVALGEDDVLQAWRSQLLVSSAIAISLLIFIGLTLWRLWRTELLRQENMLALVVARDHALVANRRLEESIANAKRSGEVLEQTGALAKVGGWEVNLQSMKLTWTRETFRIAGINSLIEPPLEDGINLFEPDARPTISAAVQAAIDHGSPYDLELPIIAADGQPKWVRTQGTAEMHGGKATRVFGTFQDITERVTAQASVREAEVLVQTIVDAVPGMLAYWNEDMTCRYSNRAYQLWFSCSAMEMKGASMRRLLGDALFQRNEPFVRAVLSGVPQHFERELRSANGDVVQTLAQYIPHWKDGKVVGFLALVTDISEVKKVQQGLAVSLQEQQALLKEVHHRVKNNLQVVTSLLRLEARRSVQPDSKVVLADMQARIRAMALVHESLYRSGTLASVELGSYLRQLSTQVVHTQSMDGSAVRLQLSLESVQMGMDQAIACGLLVNELISNSLKHGFPDGLAGYVTLDLQPLDATTQWRLQVRDTGVGLPENFEEKRKESLGMQLAADLARQIGGELDISTNQGRGVAFTVKFKVLMPAPLDMPA